ncbi:MAG: nucleotidyltransferase family protein [Candidatus Omnitrophota bacterium]
MKVLLLAAGYATRLYPLTIDQPKPLLSVAGKPVIEFILELIEPIKEVDEIFIVTNEKFYTHFEKWNKKYNSSKKIVIVNDKTTTNKNRLGATGDIDFVVKGKGLKDDLLVLAGDNIFRTDLTGFIKFSLSKRPSATIGLYDVGDIELSKKYGIVSLDETKKITEFREKPKKPASTLAAKCLYFFPKERLGRVKEYLSSGASEDAPGYFLEWLSKKEDMFGYVFKDERWFDIGDMTSYKEADRYFRKEK